MRGLQRQTTMPGHELRGGQDSFLRKCLALILLHLPRRGRAEISRRALSVTRTTQ
jgi:hypothetical protein